MIGCELVCGKCKSCLSMFVFARRGRVEEPTGVECHGMLETGYACNGCGEMSADENEPCIHCDTLEGAHPIVFCNVFMRACAARGVPVIVYEKSTHEGPGFGIEFGSAGCKFVCPDVHLNDARNMLVSVIGFVPEPDSRASLEGLLLRDIRSRVGVCGDRRQEEKHVATWLRIVADHLENGGSPYMLASDVPDRDPDRPCDKETIETFSVVLSKPWGG